MLTSTGGIYSLGPLIIQRSPACRRTSVHEIKCISTPQNTFIQIRIALHQSVLKLQFKKILISYFCQDFHLRTHLSPREQELHLWPEYGPAVYHSLNALLDVK